MPLKHTDSVEGCSLTCSSGQSWNISEQAHWGLPIWKPTLFHLLWDHSLVPWCCSSRQCVHSAHDNAWASRWPQWRARIDPRHPSNVFTLSWHFSVLLSSPGPSLMSLLGSEHPFTHRSMHPAARAPQRDGSTKQQCGTWGVMLTDRAGSCPCFSPQQAAHEMFYYPSWEKEIWLCVLYYPSVVLIALPYMRGVYYLFPHSLRLVMAHSDTIASLHVFG